MYSYSYMYRSVLQGVSKAKLTRSDKLPTHPLLQLNQCEARLLLHLAKLYLIDSERQALKRRGFLTSSMSQAVNCEATVRAQQIVHLRIPRRDLVVVFARSDDVVDAAISPEEQLAVDRADILRLPVSGRAEVDDFEHLGLLAVKAAKLVVIALADAVQVLEDDPVVLGIHGRGRMQQHDCVHVDVEACEYFRALLWQHVVHRAVDVCFGVLEAGRAEFELLCDCIPQGLVAVAACNVAVRSYHLGMRHCVMRRPRKVVTVLRVDNSCADLLRKQTFWVQSEWSR